MLQHTLFRSSVHLPHCLHFYCRPTQLLGENASSVIFIPNFMAALYVVQQLLQCQSHYSDTHECKLRHINLSRGKEREVTSDRRQCQSALSQCAFNII